MIYQSPLHIIPKSFDFDGSATQLKRLRKELMLRFDLSGHTTIDIAGRTFDKQSIIQQINALTQQSELHLKIYQQPNLLAFLENQDLAFFSNPVDWEVLADTTFQNQLQSYFTAAYSKKLKAILAQKVIQPEKELQILLNKSFHLPKNYEAAAYTASMKYLRELIREGTTKYNTCLADKEVKQMVKSASPFFEKFHLTAFLELPPYFDYLKIQYAKFSGKVVKFYADTYSRTVDMSYKEVQLMCQAASVVYRITGKYKEGYFKLKKYAASLSPPEVIKKRAPYFIFIALLPVAIIGCLYLFTVNKVETFNAKKRNALVGNWKTKMTTFNGDLTIDRFVTFRLDGTGETQLILNPQNINQCNLAASFKWSLKENVINYNYQSHFKNNCNKFLETYNWSSPYLMLTLNAEKFKSVDSAQLITVFTNNSLGVNSLYISKFKSEFPDNTLMIKEYEELLATLVTAYKENEDSLRANINYTILNVAGLDSPIFMVNSRIDTQTFHFEKVDSSYKKEIINEASSIIKRIRVE